MRANTIQYLGAPVTLNIVNKGNELRMGFYNIHATLQV